MCGIVAYIGKKNAQDLLIDGLRSLEYRGYDSSGIAVLHNSKIELVKSAGKIARLEEKILALKVPALVAGSVSSNFNSHLAEKINIALETSSCGIGHTRWATHGIANDTNAHPHQDTEANIALVHNGIIKNYLSLKQELEAEGIQFRTETDTEVITHLFAKQRAGKTDLDALRAVMNRLEGSYAVVILVKDQNKLLVAKNQSPLVIGIGEAEFYVASDSSTVLQYTNKVLKLKDQQLAEITETKITLEDLHGNEAKIEVKHLIQTTSIQEKGPYKHFLVKEIHEQPAVTSLMLAQCLANATKPITGFEQLDIDFKQINRIVFVACGSAYHAALIGKYLIELWARVPVDVEVASEYASKQVIVGANDLVIGISQSGETADTLAAINNAKNAGAQIMAITNKSDSAIYDLTSPNNYVTPAGIEVSVASTKAFVSQVLALYFLAIKIAEDRTEIDLTEIKQSLRSIPLIIDQVIERAEEYKNQFIKYSSYRDFLFLSRGINYPIALEGALKLKELSYIHATGYPSGEMKHGPIAILDQSVPVLTIAIDGASKFEHNIYEKALSNAEEARARKSPSLVIACDDNQDVTGLFDEVIRIPNIDQFLSPIIATIPLQFMAYYIAEELGKDVDQPRNLAKSVTVE
ncbi:MAG: glutamine--fructose-6-phosphate transaminase (isomerizing) [Cyanobacteria bacterium]|nr:glutamine--fructose-6-phosphate transaminase (isomerizing) [Cyanobacteriota bacterium]MDA1021651.1 glutamine--fructose-6-phosphate transaminase (isomerizing) [Cyanobacteriota bacterium]